MRLDADRHSEAGAGLRVLVVDDDPAVADVASAYLERNLERADVIAETAPQDAIERVEADPTIDCVISDYKMPGIDGLELHDRVIERRPELPFILFTAEPTDAIEREAVEAGVAEFIEKDGSARTFDVLTASVRQEAT